MNTKEIPQVREQRVFSLKKKKTGVRINQLLLVRYPMNVELINF